MQHTDGAPSAKWTRGRPPPRSLDEKYPGVERPAYASIGNGAVAAVAGSFSHNGTALWLALNANVAPWKEDGAAVVEADGQPALAAVLPNDAARRALSETPGKRARSASVAEAYRELEAAGLIVKEREPVKPGAGPGRAAVWSVRHRTRHAPRLDWPQRLMGRPNPKGGRPIRPWHKLRGYIRLPCWIIREDAEALAPTELVALWLLLSQRQRTNAGRLDDARPIPASAADLAHALDVSKPTAAKALARLVGTGRLVRGGAAARTQAGPVRHPGAVSLGGPAAIRPRAGAGGAGHPGGDGAAEVGGELEAARRRPPRRPTGGAGQGHDTLQEHPWLNARRLSRSPGTACFRGFVRAARGKA